MGISYVIQDDMAILEEKLILEPLFVSTAIEDAMVSIDLCLFIILILNLLCGK